MIPLPGFTIGEKLYENGKTIVYRAEDNATGRSVILKLMKNEHPGKDEIARMMHEYEMLSACAPLVNVIDVHYFKEYGKCFYLVLEDFGGTSVGQYIRSRKEPLPIGQFLSLAVHMTDCLCELHGSGVLHGDINPSNFVYNPATEQLKMIDLETAAPLTKTGAIPDTANLLPGTMAYISPEQTGRINRRVDWRTDLYSLGVSFYEMLTGSLPFPIADPFALIHAHIARAAVPPCEIDSRVPKMISSIIMKLLSKNPEDRYLSAAGVKADLEECLARLKGTGRIDPFPIALNDVPDRFILPSKLYGRGAEMDMLRTTLERAATGQKVMLLVSGAPGIGKTSLIREMGRHLAERNGWFISSKFDQLVRATPYSAIIGAFRELVRQILAVPDEGLSRWREKIIAALGSNCRVMIDLIPELELITGLQNPVAVLDPQAAQNRLKVVFHDFITVFCRQDHPLVIFLDDLQWADLPSLGLIETMMSIDSGALLLVLAYRDNEVEETHPFMEMVSHIPGQFLERITVGPLKAHYTADIIADIVHRPPGDIDSLSGLVQEKTGGNPFFVGEFLKALHAEDLLGFDAGKRAWYWDIPGIHAKRFTDNVVQLIMGRIGKLHADTRRYLQYASMLGNVFSLEKLSILAERPAEELVRDLDEAIHEGFVIPLKDNAFTFSHDRIQQGAYGMIKKDELPAEHLRAGRLLLAGIPGEEREVNLFTILDQFNKGNKEITSAEERQKIAELNHRAGRKARESAAFAPAYQFFRSGIDLLDEDSWRSRYDFTLAIHTDAAEAAYLSSDHEEMDRLGNMILKNARTLIDKVPFSVIKINSLSARAMLPQALDIGLQALEGLDFKVPRSPTQQDFMQAFTEAESMLAGKTTEEIANFPELTDPLLLALCGLVDCLVSVCYVGYPEMLAVLDFKAVSLLVGNRVACGSSRMILGVYAAVFLTGLMNRVERGMDLWRITELLETRPDSSLDEAVMQFANANFGYHRIDHLRTTFAPGLRGFRIGLENGNFYYAGVALVAYLRNACIAGVELGEIEKELVHYAQTMARIKNEKSLNCCQMFRQYVHNLRVLSDDPGVLSGESYREEEMLPVHQQTKDLSAVFDLFFLRLVLCIIFDRKKAVELSLIAEKYLKARTGTAHVGFYPFFDSLAHLAVIESTSAEERDQVFERVERNLQSLHVWGKHAPMNYQHKILLIEAELGRIKGNIPDAMDLYDRAIKLAGENRYINEEALANELAGRFYLSLDKPKIAAVYLAEARYLYDRWGAAAKVRQLEETYRRILPAAPSFARPLRADAAEAASPSSSGTTGALFDLASVTKASQAISQEIVLDELIGSLMTTVMENAGANRGALILKVSNGLVVRAKSSRDGTTLHENLPLNDCGDICPAVIRYADRTSRPVILSNASTEGMFLRDSYVLKNHPLSILCMPIIRQARTLGLLYLENTSVAGAFTPERVEVLSILSSQIAISLQNALLYAGLKEAEERYSSIVENAAEGIFQSDLQGRPLLVNPSLARMLGYASPAELIRAVPDLYAEIFADPLKYTLFLDELSSSGTVSGFEFTAVRLDGAPIELTMNAHTVRDAKGSPLYIEGMVQDITEKRRSGQMRIAKEAAEAATKARGEFLAKMSHEIRTPMNAILGFSGLISRTALDTKQSGYAGRIHLSAKILLQLINDILDFAKIEAGKLKVESVPFAFADMVTGLTGIMSVLASEKGIGVISDISPGIPPHVKGDPYRLTQVLTNIINNAVKFTPEGYVLLKAEVLSRDDASCVLKFTVRDTGIGMTAEQLSVIFDAFAQADDSITRKYGGTGLGLAISRQILELMGSKLTVKSAPGKGTEFTFPVAFPYPGKDETIIDLAGSLAPDIKGALTGTRVLLAEDNQVNAEVAIEILKEAGASVTHALNGKEALDMALKGACDVILMDIEMPVMGGYEAARLLRDRGLTLPVIAMTAHAMGGAREACLEAGMNDYIPKPIEPHLLVTMLARWTKESLTEESSPAYSPPPVASTRLPGIDMDAGIRRLMGKEELYKKLLVGFFRKNVSVPADIRARLEKGDREGARTLTHTLKGTASTLSAYDVNRTALNLETAIREGADCEPPLHELEMALEEGLEITQGLDRVL